MIYRYKNIYHIDPLESNMIGNLKNTDLEEKVSIKPTREEDLKTYSDSSRIQLDISIGELLETSQPCPRLWLRVSSYFLDWQSCK